MISVRALCCCLTVWLVSPATVHAACETPLRVQAEHWPPYMVDAGEQATPRFSGSDIERVSAALAAAGCEYRFIAMPPERANQALVRGDIDLMMAASLAPERLSYARFSVPYRREVIAVLGRSQGPVLHQWQELVAQQRVLLAPRYGYYGREWEQHSGDLLAAGVLLFYNSYTRAVGMLKAGRADYVLGDMYALQTAGEALGSPLSEPYIIVNDNPVHLMYSRVSVSQATVDLIDSHLRAGEY